MVMETTLHQRQHQIPASQHLVFQPKIGMDVLIAMGMDGRTLTVFGRLLMEQMLS